MTIHVCATTAQFPGCSAKHALEQIQLGCREGLWGALSSDYVQICPQSMGVITEDVAEHLREQFPDMNLRLHANARVLSRHVLWDVSTFSSDTQYYYEALADRMCRLGGTVMSIHAGYQDNCSEQQMWDNIRLIDQCMKKFGNIDVAVEGLYPNAHRPQFIGSWASYSRLLQEDVFFAIDLSHLKIVARHEGVWEEQLVQELLLSPRCKEIHVSDNNGSRDSHHVLINKPVWWDVLHNCAPYFKDQVVFSEGNLLKA